MKKSKLIFIIIAAVILIATLAVTLTACGGDEGGGGSSGGCVMHFDENLDGQCDNCDFMFNYNSGGGETESGVSSEVVATKFNDFFSSSIDLSAFMQDRWIFDYVTLQHTPGNTEEKIKDPNIQEVVFSNNIAHVLYKKPQGDNYVSEEYFVLNSNGYYVIQKTDEGERYIFKEIAVPDLSKITLYSEDVIYDVNSDWFYIDGYWMKNFFITLFTNTNLLENMEEREFTNTELIQLFNNTEFSTYVRLDSETEEITYFDMSVQLNQNGAWSDIFSLLYEKTDSAITLTVHKLFNEHCEYELEVDLSDEEYRYIRYHKVAYNKVGNKDGELILDITARPSIDETIILQASTQETMNTCDRLLNNYYSIAGHTNGEFTLENGDETCSDVYAYDTQNRCYLHFIRQENEDGEMVYVFNSLQIYIDERDVCMIELPSGSNLKLISHGQVDAWKDLIIAKYAGLFYANNLSADGCNHVIVNDDEYGVELLFFRVGDAYQLIDFDMNEYPSTFICRGTIDLSSRTISILNHAYNETLLSTLQSTTFLVVNSTETDCPSIAIYDSGMDSYMIFKVKENEATFTHFQPMSNGMCVGTLYLETSSITIDYHYNH